jgi:hypothetical protein
VPDERPRCGASGEALSVGSLRLIDETRLHGRGPFQRGRHPEAVVSGRWPGGHPVPGDLGGNQITCSSDCGDQIRFVEEHSAPDSSSGQTWEEKYPDYPKTKVTIQATPPIGMSAADRAALAVALRKVRSKKNFFGNGADTPSGLAAMSGLFWKTYCDKAKSCPKDKPNATSVSDFGCACTTAASAWSCAAVWLLERHGVCLGDPRFLAHVEVTESPAGEPWAGIDVKGVDAAIDAG